MKSKKGKFLLGIGAGLGLGLLLAPKKGEETREDLKVKINELIAKLKEVDTEEVKENITEKLTELQNEIRSLDKEKVVQLSKEKGEAIIAKADELVKVAIDKGTPAVKKAAKEVKNATVVTLKKLASKLEDEPKASKTKKTTKKEVNNK